MPQAIRTHFIAPTNTKGARICATAQAGRRIYAWDHSLDVSENHRAAAAAYRKDLGWIGDLAGGQLPDQSFAWCFTDRAATIFDAYVPA